MNVPLAVVERSGAVRVLRGSDSRVVLDQGRWPSWRPGHSEIAASLVTTGESPPRGLLRLAAVEGSELRTLTETEPGAPPAIAPGVPNYALWSPDGSCIAVALPTADGLDLQVVEPSGGPARTVAAGGPLFSAWTADSERLVVHAGGDLLLLDRNGAGGRRVLSDEAAGFRAPAVTPGGTIGFATPAGAGVRVMSCSIENVKAVAVAEFPGGVALSVRPGDVGEYSVAVMHDANAGLFAELWAVPADAGGGARRVVRSQFAAAFWSPSGDRVGLVVPGYTGDGRYSVHIHDAGGAFLAATEPFVPSDEFRMMLAFFDQYAQSHPAWSPDGGSFVVPGRIATDGVSASFGDARNAIYLWAAERGTPLRRIAEGDFAAFPRP